MSSKRSVYDEDDYDDYGDEEYYGDYGDFDPGESQVAGKQSAKVLNRPVAIHKTECTGDADIYLILLQTAAKVTDKNKPKGGKKAGKTQAQSHTAAPAGASALAQTLFSSKPPCKGGEITLKS